MHSVSTCESTSVIFSLKSILRSLEVTKVQIWQSVILFLEICAIISEPIITSKPRKKALDNPFKALSLTCHQNWPNFKGLGYRGKQIVKITFKKRFFANDFWTKQASNVNLASRVPYVETCRKMYILTLKGQCQNLTSGQGHLRSRIEPSRSYYISINAYVQEKHIGIIPSALSLFYQKLRQKTNVTSYDLEWPEGEVIGSKLHRACTKWPWRDW